MKTPLRLLTAASLVVLVAGCGGPSVNGTTGGYVSGDGAQLIVQVAPADRKPAPELRGPDLSGKQVSSADFAGKTLVVNLWGSWCPPCRAEAADLDAVARKLKPTGVEFLGIATREDAQTTLAFTRKHNISYPSISDPTEQNILGFAKSLPTGGIPTTWVIDANGKVAARIIMKTTAATLTGLIEDVQKSTT